ncbi:hypothetical protein KSP39_PZI012962 [Platanthera zijinensis]|uniref:CCHC-type domain-containing protein n=1 Tax=Platanthera zijinensis TaxID=2320716 RepID=A0AAP0G379_9ASPA
MAISETSTATTPVANLAPPPPTPSENLSTVSKLVGSNYPDWSVSFTFLLRSQRKRHHLTDDPPPPDSAQFDDWDASDALVLTWLANNLSDECLPVIRHDETVKAAWLHLAALYSKGTQTSRIYTLYAELFARPSMSPIAAYQQVHALGSEILQNRPFSADLAEQHKHFQELLVVCYLLRLPESFDMIRHQILGEAESPTLDATAARITVITSLLHRPLLSSPPPQDSYAHQAQRGGTSGRSQSGARGSSRFLCSHCGRTGHSVERCWQKHPHLRPSGDTSSSTSVSSRPSASVARTSGSAHVVTQGK